MSEQSQLVCPMCGHAIFAVYHAAFHCCKCGSKVEAVTVFDSGKGREVETVFEPRSSSGNAL
jgi:hypothetical protein